MQICEEHWEQMKQKVKDLGLWAYVAEDGEEAGERLKKELSGEKSIPDPLLSGNNAFIGQAVKQGGIGVMGSDEDGEHYCPLCLAKENGPDGEDLDQIWIEGFYEELNEYFIENGLKGN